MLKRSLFLLFSVTVVYLIILTAFRGLIESSPWIYQSISMLYAWSPGLIGLYFASQEEIKLPFLTKPNLWYLWIPLIAIALASLSLIASKPLRGVQLINPQLTGPSIGSAIGVVAGILLIALPMSLFIMSFIFLGSELYWRGYFWEKIKEPSPYRGIWKTALVWCLWQMPVSIVTNRAMDIGWPIAVVSSLVIAFVLSPLLTWARLRTGSVMGAAYTYASLMAGFLLPLLLFPVIGLRDTALYGGFYLAFIIVFSLVLRLHLPSTWKKLV